MIRESRLILDNDDDDDLKIHTVQPCDNVDNKDDSAWTITPRMVFMMDYNTILDQKGSVSLGNYMKTI